MESVGNGLDRSALSSVNSNHKALYPRWNHLPAECSAFSIPKYVWLRRASQCLAPTTMMTIFSLLHSIHKPLHKINLSKTLLLAVSSCKLASFPSVFAASLAFHPPLPCCFAASLHQLRRCICFILLLYCNQQQGPL